MAIRHLSASRIGNKLPKTANVWDGVANFPIAVEYLVIAGGGGGGTSPTFTSVVDEVAAVLVAIGTVMPARQPA